jgi:NAD(P)-dependent dehydrogenase (short-subunit alcohol dehydrogenase family)
MRELSPVMVAAGYGRIVNVSSVHSHLSEPGCLTYDASKGALETLTMRP